MTRSMQKATCNRSLQKGVSLLESLVALLVLAMGVLGMLGVQLKTMADNQTATNRVVAARLAEDLFERMKANATGTAQPYSLSSDWAAVTAPASSARCDAEICTSAQQATFDVWRWQTTVRNTLPGGNATTFLAPSDNQQLGVMVSWRLRNTDQTGNSAADTARAGWLNVDVGGGPTCPAGSACLVSYAKP